LIVQKLGANPAAIGIFGFSFLDQNEDRVQGSPVDGTPPTFENIASGSYPISRSLYLYVKKAHVDRIRGLREYIGKSTSEKAVGSEGYLSEKGLIPLPESDRQAVRIAGENLELLSLLSPASAAP
jgi:phosphate transport system substrate-binding protein